MKHKFAKVAAKLPPSGGDIFGMPQLHGDNDSTCKRCRCIRACRPFVGFKGEGICALCHADPKGSVRHAAALRFRSYQAKANADKRQRGFALTLEHFVKAWRANCHYCDAEIMGVGFDRVDNDKGYTARNVVPCCGPCNRMKLDLHKKEFESRIMAIAKNIARRRQKARR